MAGFKWRRIFWGMNASPIAPAADRRRAGPLGRRCGCCSPAPIYYLLIVAFGAVGDPLTGALMPLVGVLGGLAFGLPLMAFSASLTEDKGQFALVQRFVFTPLFLFSGTFFPLATLPVVAAVDRLDLAAVARERDRPVAVLRLTAGRVAGRLAPGGARRARRRSAGCWRAASS